MQNLFKYKSLIALGSNIEPREEYLKKATEKIQKDQKCVIIKKSQILDNPPVIYTNQNFFLNQILEIKTFLNPYELLLYIKALEKQLGRKERFRYGPREIDIDILYFENYKIFDKDLIIPHPGIKDREYIKILLNEFNLEYYEKIYNS